MTKRDKPRRKRHKSLILKKVANFLLSYLSDYKTMKVEQIAYQSAFKTRLRQKKEVCFCRLSSSHCFNRGVISFSCGLIKCNEFLIIHWVDSITIIIFCIIILTSMTTIWFQGFVDVIGCCSSTAARNLHNSGLVKKKNGLTFNDVRDISLNKW